MSDDVMAINDSHWSDQHSYLHWDIMKNAIVVSLAHVRASSSQLDFLPPITSTTSGIKMHYILSSYSY